MQYWQCPRTVARTLSKVVVYVRSLYSSRSHSSLRHSRDVNTVQLDCSVTTAVTYIFSSHRESSLLAWTHHISTLTLLWYIPNNHNERSVGMINDHVSSLISLCYISELYFLLYFLTEFRIKSEGNSSRKELASFHDACQYQALFH